MKNTIKQVLLRAINSQLTLNNILKIIITVLILKLLQFYIFNLNDLNTTISNQALLWLFVLPLRTARFVFRSSHKLLKFEAARAAITSSLRRFNRPVRATTLRGFDWSKLLWFITGETLFTFMFSVLTYLLLLILAGLWTYLSQEHLDKVSLIFT